MAIIIIAWILVAVTVLSAIECLRRLYRGTRTSRPPRGAHARIEKADPASSPRTWQELRSCLMGALTGLGLTNFERHNGTVSWLVALCVFAILIWEFSAWLKLTEPGARRKAWNRVSIVLLGGTSALYVASHGFRSDYGIWLFGLVFVIVVAPDLDTAARAWLGRRRKAS